MALFQPQAITTEVAMLAIVLGTSARTQTVSQPNASAAAPQDTARSKLSLLLGAR